MNNNRSRMKRATIVGEFIALSFILIILMMFSGCASISNSMIKTCLDAGGTVEYRKSASSNFFIGLAPPPTETFKCKKPSFDDEVIN